MEIRPIPAEATWPHRQKIMYPDLSVEEMILEKDQTGQHLGLFIDNRLITAISLFFEGNEMQFRKLATLQSKQGKGYGTKMLSHVFEIAKRNGIQRIWCNSRLSACGLYEKFGMNKTKDTYTSHGIDFVIMEKWIA